MFKMTNELLDWKFFGLMFAFAAPGMILGTGGFIRAYWPYVRNHFPNPGKIATQIFVFLVISLVTSISIATGIIVAPTINSRFIYFQSLLLGHNKFEAFWFEFSRALLFGFAGAMIFLIGYYTLFRKKAEEKFIINLETQRNHLGLAVRMFFNAITGEIIFRWGVQSFMLYIFMSFIPRVSMANVAAIVITCVIYASCHLFLFQIVSGKKNTEVNFITFSLYFWLSLIYGILFWKVGIFSAMTAHVILHIVWYPLDIFYYRKMPEES